MSEATMLDYIREQASLFAGVLAQRETVAKPFCEVYNKIDPDRIYLIASGTSRNAALAAAPFMEWALGKSVIVLAPSQVSKVYGNPLVIVISQGGNSTNSLAVFDKLTGVTTIAMTGNPYGYVNKKGDVYVEIPCGDEYMGPKTKGYTITILTLYCMAMECAKATGALTAETYVECVTALRQAADEMAENIETTCDWTKRNADVLNNLKTVYLVGKKQCGQVAVEGALKLQETLLIPAVGYDFEEFLHGPTSSVNKNVDGFYLLPTLDDADYERMQRLITYHRESGGIVCTVGLQEGSKPLDCVVKTTGKWYTQPFEQILPMQIISALIPENIGVQGLGSQRFKKLDAVMGIKAKNDKGIV